MENEPGIPEIDTSKPHPARMYNAYLGGTENYPADQEAVRQVLAAAPEVREIARENRAFLQRAVRFLTAGPGIRQLIDIGTGIPTAGTVHEVAGEAGPGTRVAYVDNDPVVHAHATALLDGHDSAGIILADLREPEAILAHPAVRELIDFTEPVGLLLVAVLHFITDSEQPGQIVATLRDALPAGSYLVLSHVTGDLRTEAAQQAATVYNRATASANLRSHAEITALFDGWELVEPGLVQVPLWRPAGEPPGPADLSTMWIYGGVGHLS